MKSNRKVHIVFVLPSLVPGGAERVMSFICQSISKKKFEAELLIIGSVKDTSYNTNGIKVTYLNKQRVLYSIPLLYMILAKKQPDIVFSSISYLNTVLGFLAFFLKKPKFIGREANIPSVIEKYMNRKIIFDSVITKFCYKYLDVLICQSKDMLVDIKSTYKISDEKLRLINNPVTDSFNLKQEKEKKGNPVFITVARMKKQKGHLRILNSLSSLDFDFTYYIVGDGPEKNKILSLAKKLGLNKKIVHIPYTEKVFKYLQLSDYFLQGAYVEGFPNCLLESCAVGTPIIAFDAPGGLNEIIVEDMNGYIAKDHSEFVQCIQKACKKDWDPKSIRKNILDKYGKEKILNQYEKLFFEVYNHSK
ncbi:glycosyltransferase [uncultured Croceitalea sp.]|uniref:glycosyltransferase n=1 Tax=uncultured Croceitalea sp. TaxID=1798908 RepID=UPI00374E8EC4